MPTLDVQRLETIKADGAGHPLSEAVPDWQKHEQKIFNTLPNFAFHGAYQAQHFSEEDYARAFERVRAGRQLPEPTDLDREYGARVVKVAGVDVTRPYLDSAIELDFLARHLPSLEIGVLDIGAGYGRLARVLARAATAGEFPRIYTVDAIPVSAWLCEYYCAGTRVETLTLKQFEERHRQLDIGLVINIHSWNECSYGQVARWLEYVVSTRARYLFTVTWNAHPGITYHTHTDDRRSFRPLLEAHFDQLAEEDVSVHAGCPLALWKRRLTPRNIQLKEADGNWKVGVA
jgi:hypothetical protein